MSDRPILFSEVMVRSLLSGSKTQTRRVLKPQPDGHVYRYGWSAEDGATWSTEKNDGRIPIWAGDRLWVKEEWSGVHAFRDVRPSERESFATPDGPVLREDIWYWADGNPTGGDYEKPRPSLFMPRWASRVTLLVDDVKVERLQDISEDDAIAEGITRIGAEYIARGSKEWDAGPNFYTIDLPEGRNINDVTAVDVYRRLWETINGEGSWDTNPWVACYRFRVVLGNIDQIGGAA